jgi:Rrf2 family protein
MEVSNIRFKEDAVRHEQNDMLITRETDYAVRTIVYLAKDPDQVASATEIAKAMHIPKSFLAKILQRLVRCGMLTSSRGASGGFRLIKKASEISLLDILTAFQGPAGINTCAVDKKRCKLSSTCAVHPIWVDIRKEVEARLKRETIEKIINR